jgi:hypothetical protein
MFQRKRINLFYGISLLQIPNLNLEKIFVVLEYWYLICFKMIYLNAMDFQYIQQQV